MDAQKLHRGFLDEIAEEFIGNPFGLIAAGLPVCLLLDATVQTHCVAKLSSIWAAAGGHKHA